MEKILFNTNVESAEWSSTDNCWHLVTITGKKFSCNVLFGCTGYFSYEKPYEPTFPGKISEIKWTIPKLKANISIDFDLGFARKLKRNCSFFKHLGQENFPGEIIHTQKWIPEQHDKMILDKKVAIIGSGATAVTAFPAVAKVAEHVTLVQRTPTYIVSMPSEDKLGKIISNRCYRILHSQN